MKTHQNVTVDKNQWTACSTILRNRRFRGFWNRWMRYPEDNPEYSLNPSLVRKKEPN